MNSKIDFVITWVDGNDSEWQAEKKKYKTEYLNDDRPVRYRDMELLKYWFRGVEKFATWVNKIYFVTWRHVPSWLNLDNPKLVIIKHEDFIPKEFLPTFNSCCIELNFHRIKNLSDNFVYFNDDMFLTKNVKDTDFFKDGKPRDTAIVTAIAPTGKDFFEHRVVNNTVIINKYYKKHEVIRKHPFKWFNFKYGKDQIRTLLLLPWSNFPSIKAYHLPESLQKDTYNKLWELEPELLYNSCVQKFRNITSVSPWLFLDWQKVNGNFIPRKSNFGKYYTLEDENTEIVKNITKQKYSMICLNDGADIKDFNRVKNEISNAFETILPEKSSFEK